MSRTAQIARDRRNKQAANAAIVEGAPQVPEASPETPPQEQVSPSPPEVKAGEDKPKPNGASHGEAAISLLRGMVAQFTQPGPDGKVATQAEIKELLLGMGIDGATIDTCFQVIEWPKPPNPPAPPAEAAPPQPPPAVQEPPAQPAPPQIPPPSPPAAAPEASKVIYESPRGFVPMKEGMLIYSNQSAAGPDGGKKIPLLGILVHSYDQRDGRTVLVFMVTHHAIWAINRSGRYVHIEPGGKVCMFMGSATESLREWAKIDSGCPLIWIKPKGELPIDSGGLEGLYEVEYEGTPGDMNVPRLFDRANVTRYWKGQDKP